MNIIQYLTVGIHTCFRTKKPPQKNPCLPCEMCLSLSLRGVNLGNLYLIKSPRGQRSKISIKCAGGCKIFEYFRIFRVSFRIFPLSFWTFLNVFERFRIFSNTHFNTPALLIENLRVWCEHRPAQQGGTPTKPTPTKNAKSQPIFHL